MNLHPLTVKAVVEQHLDELRAQARVEQGLRAAPEPAPARRVLPANPNNLRRKLLGEADCNPRAA